MAQFEKYPAFRLLCRSLRALVSDDDRQMADIIADILRLCPAFCVFTTYTARQAHTVIDSARGELDIALLDLGFPQPQNAYELIQRLAPHTPTVIITGRVSHNEAERCRELGAVKVIDKTLLDTQRLLETAFILAVRARFYSFVPRDAYLRTTIDTLFSRQPQTVAQWTAMQEISESYLRKKWETAGLKAKHILELYQAYMLGFICYRAPSNVFETHRDRLEAALEYVASRMSVFKPLIFPQTTLPTDFP